MRLSIDERHCDHCEVTVRAALERAGPDEARVDWRLTIAGEIRWP